MARRQEEKKEKGWQEFHKEMEGERLVRRQEEKQRKDGRRRLNRNVQTERGTTTGLAGDDEEERRGT